MVYDHINRARQKKSRRKKDEKLRQEYEETIKFWEKNASLNPESISNWATLGEFYERIRDWNRALECYNKALEIEPNYKRAKLNKKQLERKISRIYKKGSLWEYEY
jgi:tetratricopeptide (TPR) repeat protein